MTMLPIVDAFDSFTRFSTYRSLNDSVRLEGDHVAWAMFSRHGESQTHHAVSAAEGWREYRYALGRRWASGGGLLIACGINPSKAGAYSIHEPLLKVVDNDPTVRKLIGFGRRLDCNALLLVNLAARIATDPRYLTTAPEPVGVLNLDVLRLTQEIRGYYDGPSLCVAAWGRMPSQAVASKLNVSREMIDRQKMFPWCWGKTQDGEPRHPLMLPYATNLVLR